MTNLSPSVDQARENARDKSTGQFGEQLHTDPGVGVLEPLTPPPVEERLAVWLGDDKVAYALVEPEVMIGLSEKTAAELLPDLADVYRVDPQMAGLTRDVDEWADQRRKLDDQLDNTTSDDGIDFGGWDASDEEAARLCREFGAWLSIDPVFPARLGSEDMVRDDDGLLASVGGPHLGDGWEEFVDTDQGEVTISVTADDVRRAAARAAAQVDRLTRQGMWVNQRWDDSQGTFFLTARADRGEALAQAGWDGCVGRGDAGDGWFEMVDPDDPGRTVRIFEAKPVR